MTTPISQPVRLVSFRGVVSLDDPLTHVKMPRRAFRPGE